MTIKNLKNKDITVMGLGRLGGGVPVVKFLASHGARVLVTDIKKAEALADSIEMLKQFGNVEFVLGQHRNEDFIDRDFVIKNPGVPKNSPYLRVAREHNVPIETDISLFFKLTPATIIGVTGTKGKSTTASLIYEFLKESYTTFLAGNIGKTPLDIVEQADANSFVVLELSSWQLEDLASFKVSPHIGVVTNIYPDHLNRHINLEDYIEAKKNILRFGTKESIAVLNFDDEAVKSFGKDFAGQVYYFSMHHKVNGVYLQGNDLFFNDAEEPFASVADMALAGSHNVANVLAASTVAKHYKIKSKSIRKTLAEFTGVPFRQELIRDIGGISFYNDTTATIPEATIAALKRFGKRIILIAGGVDKELDYAGLAKELSDKVRLLILLPGSASDKLSAQIHAHHVNIPVHEVESMDEAVAEAFRNAKSGDVVVLSPGAASFNLFKNEFDRGQQFNAAVQAL